MENLKEKLMGCPVWIRQGTALPGFGKKPGVEIGAEKLVRLGRAREDDVVVYATDLFRKEGEFDLLFHLEMKAERIIVEFG